ncbi:MAG: SusC/RagA family TonB-linked outer membrane protein [Gemmatimonadetes bacterium]|nr:SusC/RagA family TonB-linked outer membrane protein [Gemmatimonadota bacterium]
MSPTAVRLFTTLALATALPAAAQQGGTIAGTVTDDRAVPIAGARVSVAGTTLTVSTDGRGRFLVQGVTGASVTLRVSMIGFKPTSVTTDVGKQDLTITLAPSIFSLGDVVVTGTAGGEEKRAVGNAVSRLDVSGVNRIAPAADLAGVLNGRISNLVLQATSGAVGSGGKIRLRGTSSLSLNNQPLVYIDGVRADNSNNTSFAFGSTSRLNDIDPSSIESIEVIKGPAASTLYGTEAINGVIQIITKKGTQGRAQIGVETGQGVSWMWNPEKLFERTRSFYRDAGGAIKTLNLVQQETDSGRPIFQNGSSQRYGIDITGGNQGIQYFIAGSYDGEEGVLRPNRAKKWNGRVNLQATVTPKLTVSVNGAYTSSLIDIPPTELMRGVYAPYPLLLGTRNRGFLTYPPEVARVYLSQVEDVARTTGGIQLNHSPTSWLTQRLNVGIDELNEASTTTNPFLTGFAAQFFTATAAQGGKGIARRDITATTLDYNATASKGLTAKIGSKTSAGLQFYRKFQKIQTLTGTGFPAPGVSTISSTATRNTTETFVENKTFGVYVQEQLSYNNRFFLTGAIRADDNSAFGADFDLVTYPKISASWVVSEEPFWPSSLASTFRLRGAYGRSGQQPDQFAALRSYQAVPGPGGTPAVRPQFFGNPTLGPERGSEIEIGFEAGLFDDRLGVDFTYFDKKTNDAILGKSVAPSEGFGLGVQFVNIGQVLNRGWELQLNGTPISKRNLKMDLSFSLSHTRNEITDMGGVGDITGVGINQIHREGFPVAAFFYKRVVSAELGTNGQPTNIMCDPGVDNGHPGGTPVPCAQAPAIYGGQPLPNYEGAINTTIQLFERLTLSGIADFKTGGRNFSADIAIQCQILRTCEANVDPASDLLGAADMLVNNFGVFSTPEARFLKIRQISASYRLPERWAQYLGGSSAQISVAARNIHTFTNFKLGPDPELGNVYTAQHNQEAFQAVPMPFQLISTLRVTF